MNITKENIDELNATVTITLEPSDYQPQVDKVLKDHAKKSNMPGFRPGKVPFGVIKKKFGISVLIEEVNKMLGNHLYEYIGSEKLEVLGNPLPSETVVPQADWENPKDLVFTYDLGLAPEIKYDLARKVDFYIVKPTEKDIENSLENVSKRSGEMIEHDTVADNDLVLVQWVELNDDESIKEGGIMNSSSVSLDTVKDEAKKDLIGKKLGDSLVVNHMQFSENEADRAAMLSVKKEELAGVNDKFKITIEKIQRLKIAELNEELFKKLYPDGSVTNIDEMKGKIEKDYSDYFSKESDRKLKNDIVMDMIKDAKFSLPDTFLKRWLMTVGENKPTKEAVESEYDNYSQGLRWQLIENRIIRENNISVSEEELKAGIREQLLQQFAYYGMQQADDEMMDDMVQKFMKREDEVRKVSEQLYDARILALLKEKAKLKEKEMNSEEFYEMLSKENKQ